MSFYLLSRFDIDKSTFDPAAVNRGFYDPEFTLKLGDQLRLLKPAANKQEREGIEKAIVAFIKDHEYPTEQEVGSLIAQQRKYPERRRINREKRGDLGEGRRSNGGIRTTGIPSGPGIDADAAEDPPRWPLIGAVALFILSITWWVVRKQQSTTQTRNA